VITVFEGPTRGPHPQASNNNDEELDDDEFAGMRVNVSQQDPTVIAGMTKINYFLFFCADNLLLL
jgi:hypothetical protein